MKTYWGMFIFPAILAFILVQLHMAGILLGVFSVTMIMMWRANLIKKLALTATASPVGVNSEIVDHCVNELLVQADAEWVHALDRLFVDPKLRRRVGAARCANVEREYSLPVNGPNVKGLLREGELSGRTTKR